jgi:hypothetical protein
MYSTKIQVFSSICLFILFYFILGWVSLETQEHPTQHITKGEGQLVELQWNSLRPSTYKCGDGVHWGISLGMDYHSSTWIYNTFMLIVDLTYGQFFKKVLQTHPIHERSIVT